MTDLSIPYVAFAGLLSFLSPCVLPLVPPYLCYLAGTTLDEWTDENESGINRMALMAAFLFVLGFSTVFVLLGAGASVIGAVLRQNSLELGWLAGAIIIGMVKGETREGDFSSRLRCWVSSVMRPPMPLPTMQPKRSRSTLSRSTPESRIAITDAAMPSWAKGSARRASLGFEKKGAESKPRMTPAILQS